MKNQVSPTSFDYLWFRSEWEREWSVTCSSSFRKDLHVTACMFTYRPCSYLFSFVTQLTCWLYHLLSFGGTQTACILFMVFLNCYQLVNFSYFLRGVWDTEGLNPIGKIIMKKIQTLFCFSCIQLEQERAPHIFCAVHWSGDMKRN